MTVTEIIEALPLGIHIIDRHGMTVFYNETCRRIDDLSDDIQVIGLPFHQFVESGIFSNSIGLEVLSSGERKESVQSVKGKQVYSQGIPVFDDKEEIDMVIVTTMDIPYLMRMDSRLSSLRQYNQLLIEQLQQYSTLNELNSSSRAMEIVKRLADKAAQYDSNVLITGESGVGKGVLLRYIQSHSLRKDKPIVTLNCAAIPEPLFESELFGYEPGSFTGASKQGKKGLLDLADKGTLFLDEVGDLSLSNQAKLLSVIQERSYIAVGGLEQKTCDVRIIAATNKRLDEMVAEGTFREDLFYRLTVFPIHIPPLRERQDDIVTLTRHFLENKNRAYGLAKEFSGDILRAMYLMDWPGNARELENYVERLLLTSDSDYITLDDMKALDAGTAFHSPGNLSYQDMIDQHEIDLLNKMLSEDRSIRNLSKKYQINESTLRKKLKRFEIEP